MLKILTAKDIPAVRKVILENKTLQGKPIPEKWMQATADKSEINLTSYQSTQPYYGEFDSDNNLLSFVRFEIWDEKDQKNTCTMGITFATNSIPLPKVRNSRWSQTIINIYTFAYEDLVKRGIREGYCLTPATSTWLTMGDIFPYSDQVKREEVMIIPPNINTSGNKLFDKYLLQYNSLPQPQVIVRMSEA